MNVDFQYSKTLAGEGSILLLLSVVPYVGWVLGIIGVALFLSGVKELSNYYADEKIYQNSLTGVKFYIVALIAAGIAIAALVIGIGSATGFTFKTGFKPTAGFAVGLVTFLAGLVIAFVFYLLATSHLRNTFNALAEKSGEKSFTTAGDLLRWGAILTIVLVGFVLIFVAWIFAIIGFFTMKSRQVQQYAPPPPSENSPQPTLSSTQSAERATNVAT